MKSVAEEIDGSFDISLYPYPRLVYCYPDQHPWPKTYNYKLALIPMELPPTYFDEFERGDLRLMSIKKEFAGPTKEMILECTKNAIELGAKIIVFNEFSYPILEHSELSSELIKLCDKSISFVIPGSFHETRETDSEYGFSKCPIFFYEWCHYISIQK
jgi:hypothetical protein